MQHERFQNLQLDSKAHITVNAHAEGDILESTMILSAPAKTLLNKAAEKMRFSARAYFRLIRVSRTIADLAGQEGDIQDNHVAEALSYRKISLN